MQSYTNLQNLARQIVCHFYSVKVRNPRKMFQEFPHARCCRRSPQDLDQSEYAFSPSFQEDLLWAAASHPVLESVSSA